MRGINIIFAVFSILLVSTILVIIKSNKNNEIDLLGEVHEHADFKVILNGTEYNFNNSKYMSDDEKTLSPFVHLHDMEGQIIHKHISGVTLGEFFKTIGMKFNATCFILDNKEEFCSNENKKIRIFVNGKESFEFGDYEFADLDRILIIYGNVTKTNINEYMKSVTDKACIQSGLCPERGSPSDESSCTALGGCEAI